MNFVKKGRTKKNPSLPQTTASSVKPVKDQRGQTETMTKGRISINSNSSSHQEVRTNAPPSSSSLPVSPKETGPAIANSPTNKKAIPATSATHAKSKAIDKTTRYASSSTNTSATAPSTAVSMDTWQRPIHSSLSPSSLSCNHPPPPPPPPPIGSDRTTSWAFRINRLMNRQAHSSPKPTQITNNGSDDYDGEESDAYLKMDQYDFMNLSEMVQNSSDNSTTTTEQQHDTSNLSGMIHNNFSNECTVDENSTVYSHGAASSSAFSFQLFRTASSRNSPRQQQQKLQKEYFGDETMQVREQTRQQRKQNYVNDDASRGSSSTLSDFQDWTPQDSAYGAACPVCGWIPKNIRQLIEYTLLTLIIFSIVYLIVTTSIRISSSSSSSSSSATNNSGGNLVDDDYFVEWGDSENYSNSGSDEDESVDDDDDYLSSRTRILLRHSQQFQVKKKNQYLRRRIIGWKAPWDV